MDIVEAARRLRLVVESDYVDADDPAWEWMHSYKRKEDAVTIGDLNAALSAIEGETKREADLQAMREQGQSEGFAAAVAQLRDMSGVKPPPALWHAASLLADSLEQSRIPRAALSTESPKPIARAQEEERTSGQPQADRATA